MIEIIDKYIAKSSIIKVYVDVEDDRDEYYGIPVRRSRSLIAHHDLNDFHFDGFRILRLKDIVKIRRGRLETTQQKILRATGELENHIAPSWLRVGSWKSLLTCIMNRGLCACVASGLIEVNVLAIGEIHALKENAVVLKSFDAHGEWRKPKHRIRYSDITEVIFGDEYSVTFNAFVKNDI